jgi:hypothetical protein
MRRGSGTEAARTRAVAAARRATDRAARSVRTWRRAAANHGSAAHAEENPRKLAEEAVIPLAPHASAPSAEESAGTPERRRKTAKPAAPERTLRSIHAFAAAAVGRRRKRTFPGSNAATPGHERSGRPPQRNRSIHGISPARIASTSCVLSG